MFKGYERSDFIHRNTQDIFSSIVCAGTFAIVATQTGDVGDIDDDSEDQGKILDAAVRPFDDHPPFNKTYLIEIQPFNRQIFKDFALSVYESYNAKIETEVIDEILETTCGHPGLSMWMLIKSIQQSMEHKCLTISVWMDAKRNLYNKELYKMPAMEKMLVQVKSSKKVKRVLHVLIRDYKVNCNDVQIVSFLRAVGIAKLTYQNNFITFTSPIIRDFLMQEGYRAEDAIN